MAISRLTFLYPNLFRAGRGRGRTGRWTDVAASLEAPWGPLATLATRRPRPTPPHFSPSPFCCHHVAPFQASHERRQASFPKRAGKAIEPESLQPKPPPPPKQAPSDAAKDQQGTHDVPKAASTAKSTEQNPLSSTSPLTADSPEVIETTPQQDIAAIAQGPKGSPMDEILDMGPPPDGSSASSVSQSSSSSTSSSESPVDDSTYYNPAGTNNLVPVRKPHLTPRPYVHHFDSYTLVKQLTGGGFTQEQAIIVMKAIRGILASNLDMAQRGLVSKADMENETYLFRAACSELSAEVRNNRRLADEQLRQQRTMLQHEVDILAQRLNQELQTLNDSVRGMFNDRRMAVREEQKAMESKIQQVNYKISVMLNSDAKSNIEQLRWILIRRSVLGIIFMAVSALFTLRYATYRRHQRQKEAEDHARQAREAQELMKKHDLGRPDITAEGEVFSPGLKP